MEWLTLADAGAGAVHPVVQNVAALAAIIGTLGLILVALINRQKPPAPSPPPPPIDGAEGELAAEYIAFVRETYQAERKARLESDARAERAEAESARLRDQIAGLREEIARLNQRLRNMRR